MTEPGVPLPSVVVEPLTEWRGTDLHDMCDAAEAAIRDGGGFGWLTVPERELFESYWRGVVLVPERVLLVGRLDGTIAGAVQLLRAPRNNEAQAHAATLTASFVAPWARGHGLARRLVVGVENAARTRGIKVLNLDVRVSQTAAIALYEATGYKRFGVHPHYAEVNGQPVAGYYFYKDLREETPA